MSPGEPSPEAIARYARQMVLAEVGTAGQQRLAQASVLVVGAGGLGSPAALYLAAAGVGTLGIVDFDRVELSNLHRQVLFGDADLGREKAPVAARRLAELNPDITIEPLTERLQESNVRQTIERYDVVVDGSDNFATRYMVNDACVELERPDVFGSVLRFEGQLGVFALPDGPCYRCLFPEPPPPGVVPSCAEGGVLGALPGVIGSLQALETIKLLLGAGEPLVGRLLVCDGLSMRFREIAIARDPGCPVCGPKARSERPRAARGEEPTPSTARDQESPEVPFDITPAEVQSWREKERPFRFVDVRLPREYEIARIEGTSLLPLHELPQRFEELDRDEELVVMCHHGIRSAQAVAFLRQRGFARARNLAGGIAAWSHEIDPAIPQY